MTDNDPTLPIREKAASYAEVDEGTACTQSSFKTGGKAFLFIGEQGGRSKAMLKLNESRDEAAQMAESQPKNYELGSGQWITLRFTAEEPIPEELWTKWLDESYELSRPKK